MHNLCIKSSKVKRHSLEAIYIRTTEQRKENYCSAPTVFFFTNQEYIYEVAFGNFHNELNSVVLNILLNFYYKVQKNLTK